MKKQVVFFSLLLFFYRNSNAQNAGIGTTNPYGAKLEIHGGVEATAAIFAGAATIIELLSKKMQAPEAKNKIVNKNKSIYKNQK